MRASGRTPAGDAGDGRACESRSGGLVGSSRCAADVVQLAGLRQPLDRPLDQMRALASEHGRQAELRRTCSTSPP